MSDFISFLLFGFALIIKLRNSDFESYSNTLIFLDENDMMYDIIFIVWIHFSHKTETF